ncbi:MAG: bestrophin family ion channel, partial [Planctomycetota bacterium]
MYTRRNIRWNIVLRLSWRRLSMFALWGFLVVLLHRFLLSAGIDASIPIAPLGTIGVAVAFYVGFKNNQSYDRFWEARKIWGGIV